MTDALTYKILSRYMVQKLADTIGDPKEFLKDFEKAVSAATIPTSTLDPVKKILEARVQAEASGTAPPLSDPAVRKELFEAQDIAYRTLFKVKNAHLVANSGHQLFLSIIQQLTLPPALRKKVEVASRAYLKTTKPRFKAKSGPSLYLEYITTYEKYLSTLQAHLEIAKQALSQGKAHTEEGEGATKLKAGPFTLVNTGGFDAKQMGEVSDLVQKAAALAKSSGLEEVCYGEVQVTNTLSKRNVLAFYLIAKDELFIRANVKANTDTVQTVLHELGHRFENKFLKKGGAAVLYRLCEGQERKKQWGLDGKKPKMPTEGDTLESKGKTYIVERTVPDRNGYKVLLKVEGQPGAKATVSLDSFWGLKGEDMRDVERDPNYIGFVSDYAKRGGPSENFAEMFAYYCMGKLPVLQSVAFEETVFGVEKTASERLALRFAASQLLNRE